MAETAQNLRYENAPEGPVPAMQHLIDKPFLLLLTGLAVPTLPYIMWSVMESLSILIAK